MSFETFLTRLLACLQYSLVQNIFDTQRDQDRVQHILHMEGEGFISYVSLQIQCFKSLYVGQPSAEIAEKLV